MIPSLTYQRAKDRRAELLRGAEEYRRAGLMRITARIRAFSTRATEAALVWSAHRRPAFEQDSTPTHKSSSKLGLFPRRPREPVPEEALDP